MDIGNIAPLLIHLLKCQNAWNKWIGNMIEYKGYVGWFEFDEKSNLFLGKIANMQTLVTFQGKSVKEIKQAFQAAIDEYLGWCKKHGKEPEKPSAKIKDPVLNGPKGKVLSF